MLGDVSHRDDESVPATLTHQVLCPSIRFLVRQVEPPSESLRSRSGGARHELGRQAVGGRVDQRAGITGRKKYSPESSVKKSSAVWKPAAEGKVRPAAAPA